MVEKQLFSRSMRQLSQSTPQKPSRPFGQVYEPVITLEQNMYGDYEVLT
jgi:hypothetical protein